MKFETNLVFSICLVVARGFSESLKAMAVNKFRKPSMFQWKKCDTNFLVYW